MIGPSNLLNQNSILKPFFSKTLFSRIANYLIASKDQKSIRTIVCGIITIVYDTIYNNPFKDTELSIKNIARFFVDYIHHQFHETVFIQVQENNQSRDANILYKSQQKQKINFDLQLQKFNEILKKLYQSPKIGKDLNKIKSLDISTPAKLKQLIKYDIKRKLFPQEIKLLKYFLENSLVQGSNINPNPQQNKESFPCLMSQQFRNQIFYFNFLIKCYTFTIQDKQPGIKQHLMFLFEEHKIRKSSIDSFVSLKMDYFFQSRTNSQLLNDIFNFQNFKSISCLDSALKKIEGSSNKQKNSKGVSN